MPETFFGNPGADWAACARKETAADAKQSARASQDLEFISDRDLEPPRGRAALRKVGDCRSSPQLQAHRQPGVRLP